METTSDNFNPSKSYYQKDKLDIDSWFHVTQIDYEKLIEQYSFENLFKAFDKTQLKLLDIGCGTAKFPSLLDPKISGNIHCSVDLLDISEYCLQVAQKEYDSLKHFRTDNIYLSAAENIHDSVHQSRSYDMIWAIHSLCTIDKNQLGNIYRSCWNLLKSNGKFLIYQLAQNSSYYKLYSFYVSHSEPQQNSTTNLLTSEEHKQLLDLLGINYETIKVHFTHT
ncbi:MAG: class I SAM-dependent methyltransferase, partial [Scytonema sp. PMC 1069.18]|nr:class I SAM-dependent methyltransferase [Scytonema sp. PMC 1069.18]